MSPPRRLLIFGGIALAALGMLYGLHYAVFVEHQTLDRMGNAFAGSFVYAAEGKWDDSTLALITYSRTKYDYVRQVDVHSHVIGLAMLMVVLGVGFDGVRFSARIQWWLAMALLVGSVVFPLGVILQTVKQGGTVPSGTAALIGATVPAALAIMGAGLVTVALAGVAWGFAKRAA